VQLDRDRDAGTGEYDGKGNYRVYKKNPDQENSLFSSSSFIITMKSSVPSAGVHVKCTRGSAALEIIRRAHTKTKA